MYANEESKSSKKMYDYIENQDSFSYFLKDLVYFCSLQITLTSLFFTTSVACGTAQLHSAEEYSFKQEL